MLAAASVNEVSPALARDVSGEEHAIADEADRNWLERLKLWLIGPLASEELL